MTTVRDVTGWLEDDYPPSLAEPWDHVGLDCGDPDAPVTTVGFAVDPTDAVIAEAMARGAQLLVTHHPLLFRGVHAVRLDEPAGRRVAALLAGGVAHLCAHTNADSAEEGVNDALAAALGLRDTRPLVPAPEDLLRTLVTYVPEPDAEAVLDALAAAGAGRIGHYDRCAYTHPGEGRFRPLAGARPHLGTVGELERVAERRVEVVLPAAATARVVAALLAAHPYETPAFHVLDHVPLDAPRGTGRIGVLPEPVSAADLARRLADAVPATATGVRLGGDPRRLVRRVAVLGGAGDSHLDAARRAGVDAYVTGDLRHHPAQDFLAHDDAPVLLDVPHAAAESLWLPVAERRLRERADAAGVRLETYVSTINTDPWTLRIEPLVRGAVRARRRGRGRPRRRGGASGVP